MSDLEIRMASLGLDDLDGIIQVRNAIAELDDEKVMKSVENGETMVICMLGATGVGKSSLANTLSCIKGAFKTSADLKSETDETKGVLTTLEHKGRSH